MEILYVPKKPEGDQLAFFVNNGVACAMRTLAKILEVKFHEDKLGFWCKCPDRPGDITRVVDFYKEYPQIIYNNESIYDENEARDYYLNTLKGSKLGVGYGLVTELCDTNYVPWSIMKID